jgi:UDP-glucose 4-epimerase
MKYLVTGAAGFIGANIAQKLLDSGHQVTTIDNLSTGHESCIPKHCLFIKGDASDATSIDQLNYEKFDAILHIAGQSSGEVSFESPIYDINSNAVSTLRLLDYAVKTGCKRFIYASTMSVYGQQSNKEQCSEEDVVKPKSFYAVGKLASEQYLRIYKEQYGIDYTALRYFNVYGKGQNFSNLKQGIISIYLKQFIDDDFKIVEIKGSLNRFRDLSHIDDVTKVSIEAIDNPKFYNEIINIGTGEKTTVKTMLDLIRHYLNSDKEIIISKGTPGDQFGVYANVEKLQSIYSKKFTSFEVGLKQIITEVGGNDE